MQHININHRLLILPLVIAVSFGGASTNLFALKTSTVFLLSGQPNNINKLHQIQVEAGNGGGLMTVIKITNNNASLVLPPSPRIK